MKQAAQIVAFNFPYTDFIRSKPRPALLLTKLPGEYEDRLICMISSQLRHYLPGLDDIIRSDDEDYAQSGLKTESVFRTSRLAVVAESVLEGAIGEISAERLKRIKDNLSNWIKSS